MFRISPNLLFLILCGLLSPFSVIAQGAAPEDHPALEIASEYVRNITNQDWAAAAEKMKFRHLERDHARYIRSARNTPSVDDEVRMLKRLKVERMRDLESMSGKEFFAADRAAAHGERGLTPLMNQKLQESFEMTLLGGLLEGDSIVHVMIRTSHETIEAVVNELVIISVEKDEGDWVISPEHQQIRVQPILGAPAPAKAGG